MTYVKKSFLAKIELSKSLISRGESESNVDRIISEWLESGDNDWSSLSNIMSIEEISKFSIVDLASEKLAEGKFKYF